MGQWVRNERKNPFTFLLFALIGLLLLGMLLVVLSHTVLFTQQPQQTHQRAASNRVIKQIGPLEIGAGRPFTINGKETLLFTTGSNAFGFQVSDITTGKVLYTVPIKGFSPSSFCCPNNHGISLSPNEKELYVMDGPNSYVHVFDVSGLPTVPPKQIADIPVTQITGSENPCVINCGREGWLQHSLDGRFVYVGDAGDVIDTATRKVVAHLAPLRNTRKFLEIDWQKGWPLFTSQTKGIGYVTHPLPDS